MLSSRACIGASEASTVHPCCLPPSIHLLRMDAAGHVRPEFWPWFAEQTPLPLWLEIFGDAGLAGEYERGTRSGHACRCFRRLGDLLPAHVATSKPPATPRTSGACKIPLPHCSDRSLTLLLASHVQT